MDLLARQSVTSNRSIYVDLDLKSVFVNKAKNPIALSPSQLLPHHK